MRKIILAVVILAFGIQPALADGKRCYKAVNRVDMNKVLVIGVKNPTWYCDRIMSFHHPADTAKERAAKERRLRSVQNGSIWVKRGLILVVTGLLFVPIGTWPKACMTWITKSGRNNTSRIYAIYTHHRHADALRKGRLTFVMRHELSHVACDPRALK